MIYINMANWAFFFQNDQIDKIAFIQFLKYAHYNF